MNKAAIVLALAGCVIFNATSSSATEYYVSASSGDDNNPGTFNRPWKTIEKVNAFSFQTGDDVYFKCSDIFTPSSRLNIDWEGIADNKAVIGAYYISSGLPVAGVSGVRPIISGSDYTVPALDSYASMINISSKDYITVENIEIYHCGGYGIIISGDSLADPAENSAHFLINNVLVNGSGRGGILTNNNPYNYGIIEHCEITLNDRVKMLQIGIQSAAITSANSPYSYTIIRNNLVHHGWGEGIDLIRVNAGNAYDNSGYSTVEGNVVYAVYSTNIYIDGAHHNTIRNNLVIGPNEAALGGWWYQGGFASTEGGGRLWQRGGGIAVATEDRLAGQEASSFNDVYNNLVVGCFNGVVWSQESGVTSAFSYNKFYNNTLIGNYRNFRFIGMSSIPMSGNEIRNNISFIPSDCLVDTQVSGDGSWIDSKKIAMSHNAWTGSKPTYAGNATDVILNNNFVKTTGWQNLTGPIDASNFNLTLGNAAIDKGAALSGFNTDYFGTSRPQDAAWDIGAHEFISQSGSAPPAAPGGLSVK